MYRPPNVSKAKFIEDFSSYVEGAALSYCENIILGDLNLHLDKQDGGSQNFNDSLCQYNLTQIIDSPTHIQGHIRCGMCEGHLLNGSVPKGVGVDGSMTILPSHFRSIYLSRYPANSGRSIHGKDKYH